MSPTNRKPRKPITLQREANQERRRIQAKFPVLRTLDIFDFSIDIIISGRHQ